MRRLIPVSGEVGPCRPGRSPLSSQALVMTGDDRKFRFARDDDGKAPGTAGQWPPVGGYDGLRRSGRGKLKTEGPSPLTRWEWRLGTNRLLRGR